MSNAMKVKNCLKCILVRTCWIVWVYNSFHAYSHVWESLYLMAGHDHEFVVNQSGSHSISLIYYPSFDRAYGQQLFKCYFRASAH